MKFFKLYMKVTRRKKQHPNPKNAFWSERCVLCVHQVIYLLFSLFSIVNKIYYYFVCEYLRCYIQFQWFICRIVYFFIRIFCLKLFWWEVKNYKLYRQLTNRAFHIILTKFEHLPLSIARTLDFLISNPTFA